MEVEIQEDNRVLISIIMATYNRAHFILESLEYIQRQRFTDFECLIIDDGSTDSTQQILEPFLKQDDRFRYFKRDSDYQKGLPGSRNYGLDLSNGNYIVFMDDDDIPHPYLLEWSFEEISRNNSDYCRYLRTVFYGDFIPNFNTSKNFKVKNLSAMPIEHMITGKTPFNSCQILWKKECFQKNQFNESLMFAEEWELYSRILADGANGISIEKVLYFGRKHPTSNTGEFLKKDPIRKASKIEAAKLIITNIKKKEVFSANLNRFFIRLGFNLNSESLINTSLKANNDKLSRRTFYKLAFYVYPLLRPLLRLKGRLQR